MVEGSAWINFKCAKLRFRVVQFVSETSRLPGHELEGGCLAGTSAGMKVVTVQMHFVIGIGSEPNDYFVTLLDLDDSRTGNQLAASDHELELLR
jgi:hypothetical protein